MQNNSLHDFLGKLDILYAKSSPFFFLGLKKNTTTERSPFRAANKTRAAAPNRPPFALKPSFGTRWIGRRNPPKGVDRNGARVAKV